MHATIKKSIILKKEAFKIKNEIGPFFETYTLKTFVCV